MAEYLHDTADDGFHEIQLSGKQLVFLFMAATVASAVIFLCGVLVGRGVRAQRAGVEPEPVAATAPAPAVAESSAGAPATEPPSPPSETPDELSYHRRLQGETAPPEAVTPRQVRPAAPPQQAAPPAAAPAQPPAPTPAAAGVPAEGKAGAWVVQVTALSNAAAAQDVVRQLAAKGYPAFLVNPGPGMPVIYRVQVGGYATRGEADQTARRIEKEEGLKPVVRQNR